MRMFLRVQKNDKFRDAAILEPDHPLVIGRVAAADVSFPDDNEMSSSHASVTLTGGKCCVKDLGSTNGTFLNDERIAEGELGSGDLLRCGGTTFRVESPDEPASATVSRADTAANAVAGSAAGAKPSKNSNSADELPEELLQCDDFVSDVATEIVQRFHLDKILVETPDETESTVQFMKRVVSNDESNDCLNFLAYALPKRCGIWWAVQCIRAEESFTSDDDPKLLDTVTEWVKQPSDDLRRKAMSAAEELEMSTPAAWAGVAAFWSHGSMGPVDVPPVPADDHLAGKAISAAVVLATVLKEPEKAPARKKAFADLALQIASGEASWKD
jgi:Family of unknown function (DUF6931)/FHA domain